MQGVFDLDGPAPCPDTQGVTLEDCISMRFAPLFVLPLLAAACSAHALSIDFGNGPSEPTICSDTPDGLGALVPCSTFAYLSQSYGDVAGVSDITYSAPRVPGHSLEWWNTNYNTLYGVAFAEGGDSNSRARIEIKAVTTGTLVTLSAFDLGAYSNTTHGTTVNIYAIGGGVPLYTFVGNVGNSSNEPTHFAVNVSAVGGLWIEFQDNAYNVGIDNIQYAVATVPEPASVGLMLAGLLGIGALSTARRRG